jgi:outer membrane protein assembly factor BamB
MTTHVPSRAIGTLTIIATALATAGGTSAAANLAANLAAKPGAKSAATGTTSSPWSQTDYNAAQSRANLTETILTRAKVAKIVHLRAITIRLLPTSQSCSQEVDSLALPGSSVYTAGGGFVAKYNAANGHLLWRRSTNSSLQDILFTVAVGDGLVVFGGDQCGSASDPLGEIQAFNATTGKLAWTRPITPLRGELDTMVVSGGLVVSAGVSPGSGPQLSVRRIRTGALVWHRNDEVSCNDRMFVVAQVVITGECNNNGGAQAIVGRKLASGALAWARAGAWTLQRGDASSPAGHHVFAANPKGTLVSLNPLTGRTQFALSGATAVLAVGSAQAYAACGTDVCAYSTVNGSLRWKVSVGFTPALAAEADGVLYLDGGIALNTGNGKTIATLWTGRFARSLAISDGRVAATAGAPPRLVTTMIDLYGLKGF